MSTDYWRGVVMPGLRVVKPDTKQPPARAAEAQTAEQAQEELRKFYSDVNNAGEIQDPLERRARAEKLYALQRLAQGLPAEEQAQAPAAVDAQKRLELFKAIGPADPLYGPLMDPGHPRHQLALEQWHATLAAAYPGKTELSLNDFDAQPGS